MHGPTMPFILSTSSSYPERREEETYFLRGIESEYSQDMAKVEDCLHEIFPERQEEEDQRQENEKFCSEMGLV